MKEILAIFFRRRREAVIFGLFMIIFPLAVSYAVTEKYESSATILLTAGRFKKPFLPNEKNSQTGYIQLSMEDVASEVELLMSRPVLEKVVRDNRLDVFPEPREDEHLKRFLSWSIKTFNEALVFVGLKKMMTDFEIAVEKLSGDLDVEFLKRTNIITVEWRGYSPAQAQQVVDSVVREYIKRHIEVHGYSSALKIIEAEKEADQKRVMDLEQKVNDVKTRLGSYDIEKERALLIERQVVSAGIYEKLKNAREGAITLSEDGSSTQDGSYLRLKDELVRVEMDRIANLSTYGKDNKRVLINDQQIANLNAQLRQTHVESVASWKAAFERTTLRLRNLDAIREQLATLNRELSSALDAYQISAQKYNEASISQAMDQADIASARIVAPASYTSTPAYPRKILLLLVSMFFAGVGGVAAAFAADKSYSRVVRIDEIETYTHVPTLFTIPRFSKAELKDTAQLSRRMYRQMATLRRFLGEEGSPKTHLVCSPAPNAGSSFVAKYFALYARDTTRVAAVLLRACNQANEKTTLRLGDICKDVSASIRKIEEIDVLEFRVADEPAFDAVAFEAVLKELAKMGYANIVIDLPNERGDASFLNILPLCDYSYLNVGYDITDKFALRRYASVIEEQFETRPVGAILNLRVNEIPDFIYKRL